MAKISHSATPNCAICGKPADVRFKPFCSARCADVDLNRWLSGRYVIPAAETAEDDEEQRPPPPEKDAD
jgi:endogenous inhibitor of DNA gyrase (YacG/DUF329 family)